MYHIPLVSMDGNIRVNSAILFVSLRLMISDPDFMSSECNSSLIELPNDNIGQNFALRVDDRNTCIVRRRFKCENSEFTRLENVLSPTTL